MIDLDELEKDYIQYARREPGGINADVIKMIRKIRREAWMEKIISSGSLMPGGWYEHLADDDAHRTTDR